MNLSRVEVLGNLEVVRTKIAQACRRVGRSAEQVRIVAAAKGVSRETIAWVVEGGVSDVGQNYVAELRDTRAAIPAARLHYIGTLQSSTARHVAAAADVVQTLASPIATRKLSRRAAESGRLIDCMVEVDFTGERVGVSPEELPAFVDVVEQLDGLDLIGLMTLPPIPETPEASRPYFARLRELRDEIGRTHPRVLETSMGMSFDYEVAVAEGATMVRIGTALFGPRAQSR